MQLAIFISSLIAATIALPIPRAGVGSADVLSGSTGGTDRLLPGSTNNVLGEGVSPVDDLSKSGSGFVERSPGVGDGTGDVLSGAAGGTNALMTGGANNALNNGGNSVSDLSNSSGDLVGRTPEPGAGAGTGDLFSNTASGTNSLMAGGANNALNSAGNSASDLSGSSGDLVSRSPEPAVGAGVGDLLSGAAGGTNSLMAGGANNLLNNGGNSAADLSSSAGDFIS